MKPYTVLAKFEAKPGKEQTLKEMLTSLVAPTLQEEGCINYDLHQCLDNPAVFMFYENWASKELLEQHLASAHIQAWRDVMDDLLGKPYDVTFWEVVK